MSMLTRFKGKKLGVDIWPGGGVIKPESWSQLGGTYGTSGVDYILFQKSMLFFILHNVVDFFKKCTQFVFTLRIIEG